MADAMFTDEIVRSTDLRVCVQLRPEPLPIVGMNPVQPLLKPRLHFILRVAQHLLPAGREVDHLTDEIPIPDTIVRAARGESIPFLAGAHIPLCPGSRHQLSL